jgi:hypothetical protein
MKQNKIAVLLYSFYFGCNLSLKVFQEVVSCHCLSTILLKPRDSKINHWVLHRQISDLVFDVLDYSMQEADNGLVRMGSVIARSKNARLAMLCRSLGSKYLSRRYSDISVAILSLGPTNHHPPVVMSEF